MITIIIEQDNIYLELLREYANRIRNENEMYPPAWLNRNYQRGEHYDN